MSNPLLNEVQGSQLEATERRRPGRVRNPTDDLVQMFREPSGVVRAVWDDDFAGFDEELLDEVVVIPSNPESRANEKIVLLHVAAVIGVIAALCIIFTG